MPITQCCNVHVLSCLLLVVIWCRGVVAGEAKVAAAASLQHVLEEIAGDFTQDRQHTLKISYGASGTLAHQIAQGAPFEIFLSANEDYILFLTKRSLTEDQGVVYALGRLALFVPWGASVEPTANLTTLAKIGSGRVAIANPEHAPYGAAARQALQRAAVWADLQGQLVLGENVAQTARFIISGAVEAGIIPFALASLPNYARHGRYVELEPDLYTLLRQRMVLLKDAGPVARELYSFLQGERARVIFKRHGFGLPPLMGPSEPR
jgi:molybdate transport system substrate-binding protein